MGNNTFNSKRVISQGGINMKKLLAITAVTVLLLTLIGCSTTKPNATPPASSPAKAEITIGTEGTYAPFTFHDKAGSLRDSM